MMVFYSVMFPSFLLVILLKGWPPDKDVLSNDNQQVARTFLKKKAAVDLQNSAFTPLRSRPILNSPTFAQYFDLVRMRSNIAVSHNTNYPSLSTCQVFSCILQVIGNYHYCFTFDKTPLEPIRVLIAAARLYTLLFQGNDDLT
ncbi:unnamed protein product [Mucor circinelloides]